MEFKVPKFLEQEAKIIAGLNYKQILVVGFLGIGLMLIYLFVPLIVFLILFFSIVLGVILIFLVKIDGVPLPEVLKNSFGFFFSPKTYFWKKKEKAIAYKTPKKEVEEEIEKPLLKITTKSRLTKLGSKIDIGMT